MLYRSIISCVLCCTIASGTGWCQETVFGLLKTEARRADEDYDDKNYQAALTQYENLYRKKSSSGELPMKIARCHYFLKDYARAIQFFEIPAGTMLAPADRYCYAEALASTGDYTKAVAAYRQYLEQVPDDPVVSQKIWRLNNLQYLYEDSAHFSLRPLSLNTPGSELCAVPFGRGLIFLSNRKGAEVIEKIDGSLNTPFYKMYFSARSRDSVARYAKPVLFNRHLTHGFHAGPVAFYAGEKKMVFASTGIDDAESDVRRPLQLYFAAQEEGHWKITGTFPYNSNLYSVTDPAINTDGTVLYFSSDMRGGLGGKDLYRSEYKDGQWSAPENLGEAINTIHDEVFPFLHQDNELYFSSNGHPGFGGLDIFRARLLAKSFDEITNAGYPLNSHGDEFGIVVDSPGMHGYLTSNRKNGAYDDDLYAFDVDLQAYPLDVSGVIRVREHSWSDSSELKPFANARMFLYDNLHEAIVQESVSDGDGNFTITIPHFSSYTMRVTGPENDKHEHIVSFEIPRYRNTHDVKHEIVIVKDILQLQENKQ